MAWNGTDFMSISNKTIVFKMFYDDNFGFVLYVRFSCS